jgi:hypothetical protein
VGWRTDGRRISKLATFTVVIALCSAPSFAQKPDYHVGGDPAQRLFRLSPFAHGYIHGYESGFGMGDEDLQLGRGDQHIEKTGEYRSADRDYDRSFGDRENFRAGYREGLVVGYHDALSGGEFRALSELRRLATGLEQDLVSNSSDTTYDGGFLSGYRAARHDHANDCKAGNANAAKQRFCSGFLDGYELGEADSGAVATAQQTNAPPPMSTVANSAAAGRRAPRR